VLRLAADENFSNDIIRGLLRRRPDLDIVERVKKLSFRPEGEKSNWSLAADLKDFSLRSSPFEMTLWGLLGHPLTSAGYWFGRSK
jgi:hypothetical protein